MAPVVDPSSLPTQIQDDKGNVIEDDFEMRFMREEEEYFKKFYSRLYPEKMKNKGFPDFLTVMR